MSAAPTARPRMPRARTFLSSYARTLTNGGLRFHTDRTDVVGLLCVRQAMKGGVSTLASTPAIHNAILAKRPDLLDALFTDYWRSRFGEEGTGKDGEQHDARHRLSAADLRRARRQVHLALFADLHRGGAARGRHPQADASAEGSHRRADGDRAGAVLRDDARARRPAADQQPRHLSRPHPVRGRRRQRPRPAAAPAVALDAEQPRRCPRATRCCGAASRPTRCAAASPQVAI